VADYGYVSASLLYRMSLSDHYLTPAPSSISVARGGGHLVPHIPRALRLAQLAQEAAPSPLPYKDLEAMAARVNGTEATEPQPQLEEQQQSGAANGAPAHAPQPASPVPNSPGVDMDLTGMCHSLWLRVRRKNDASFIKTIR